jgi:hypothetical protein
MVAAASGALLGRGYLAWGGLAYWSRLPLVS